MEPSKNQTVSSQSSPSLSYVLVSLDMWPHTLDINFAFVHSQYLCFPFSCITDLLSDVIYLHWKFLLVVNLFGFVSEYVFILPLFLKDFITKYSCPLKNTGVSGADS